MDIYITVTFRCTNVVGHGWNLYIVTFRVWNSYYPGEHHLDGVSGK